MRQLLETAGERVDIECGVAWVAKLIAEGAPAEVGALASARPSLRIHVEPDRRPFDTRGWELLTRGAWRRNGMVVIENACTAGFDVHVDVTGDCVEFTYRWRPPSRDRLAARLLRSRFHLLARAVLLQYPALWTAGLRGRAPLHASACSVGSSTPLLASASGIGRSTLLLAEVENGGPITGDNLAVGDGATLWGLVEPMRVEGGGGRRMPHGRHEQTLERRAHSLEPDSLLVLERGSPGETSLAACSGEYAARSLTTSTYMAGELRRYWAFAATVAAGTGRGPASPAVVEAASAFANALPSFVMTLGPRPRPRLSELLATMEVAA